MLRLGLQVTEWLAASGPALCPSRNIRKHFAPKWKKLRSLKVIKVDLPDYHEKEMDPMDTSEEGEEKVRSRMKKAGIQPMRPWSERPFLITSTGGILEQYVPPEGDGKASLVSTDRAKQGITFIEKKSKSYLSLRKVKAYDEDFSATDFASEAQDIYVKAHTYLANGDLENLEDHVTERCYPEMVHGIKNKTLRWQFIESLEPPRVVHARHADVMSKENIFGQITVRFHTRQKLAIYDRFGRLLYGSEILAKDVLEYVVFEKQLSNAYGTWKLHAKIIPDWMPQREAGKRTFVREDEPTEKPEVSRAIIEKDEDLAPKSTEPTPAITT